MAGGGIDGALQRTQESGREEIIAIQKEEPFSLGLLQGAVACHRDARILLPEEAETRIGCGIALQHFGRAIRTTIIHTEALPRRNLLRQDGIERGR